ncbi:hypothetical protein AWB69_08974 [Caballeronia udeis]|uniref:Uncharacterized protein n=1 Tax=Caballeronia udeis TaxID=1232866 RepID=A0A158JXQ2_9BURK|nr:hypothetical protein [Caballeronia udeis]SAL73283.1 hypothetical protein AWB69_08974 [Caballeronia udeis]
MDIQSLFQFVPKGTKPPAATRDEFQFPIERAARKIGTVFGILQDREVARVFTNQRFVSQINVDVPDMSTLTTRQFRCVVRLEGVVEPNSDAARKFLQRALKIDFNFAPTFKQAIANATARYGRDIGNAFAKLWDKPGSWNAWRGAIRAALVEEGFPVTVVDVTPVSNDVRESVDFYDQSNSLTVRTSDMLQSNRVGYKARLVWGKTETMSVARLTYDGPTEGRLPGARLNHPLVANQIQPVEAWFRALLSEELSKRTWVEICAATPETMADLARNISPVLGAGTGRIVQTLVLYPVMDAQAARAESTIRFTARYPVNGIKGDGIEVEHAIQYKLVDRDRWEANGSPIPSDFLKNYAAEAAKAYLLNKRFEDVIGGYLKGANGDRVFSNAIAERIAAPARQVGYSIESVAAVLAIPQINFIQGHSIAIAEDEYGLQDPTIKAIVKIKCEVRVHNNGGNTFARALSAYDDFESRIRSAITEAVRNALSAESAFDYYSSPYVNGVPAAIEADDTIHDTPTPVRRQDLPTRIHQGVDEVLGRTYGLETTTFRLEPGNDPIIERMNYLARRPFSVRVPLTITRSSTRTTIEINAHASVFIESVDQQNWTSFYLNAKRLDMKQHTDLIEDTLKDCLELLKSIVVNTPRGALNSDEVRRTVITHFAQRMREHLGLCVTLHPLLIDVHYPALGDVAALELAALTEEFKNLLNKRAEIVDHGDGFISNPREQINKQIDEVKKEMKVLQVEVERESNTAETIHIEEPLGPRQLTLRPPAAS